MRTRRRMKIRRPRRTSRTTSRTMRRTMTNLHFGGLEASLLPETLKHLKIRLHPPI